MQACALSGFVLHINTCAPLQVVCMLSILPLAFFLGSQSQFGRLNPVNPRDYILLARKALHALRENDLKVNSIQRSRMLLHPLEASLNCCVLGVGHQQGLLTVCTVFWRGVATQTSCGQAPHSSCKSKPAGHVEIRI